MASITTSSRSTHTSDPILQPFLSPTFDPTAYLNTAIPSLHLTSPLAKSAMTLPLSELAAQTQSHIAQLSAQTTRLTATLTNLTDDILRSGSRLAYEVEVIRGEAISLTEALTDTLSSDIVKFVPGGLVIPSNEEPSSPTTNTRLPTTIPLVTESEQDTKLNASLDPPSLTSLRTLNQVRQSLQTVITTFDAALSWPLPPSMLSSSLISVSAPDNSLEAAGQEACSRLRVEIAELLALGPKEGVLAAEKRVEELRDLVGVWKGTAEVKARTRFVDGLAKEVAERRKEVEEKGVRIAGRVEGDRMGEKREEKGVWKGLQRLREEIYLE